MLILSVDLSALFILKRLIYNSYDMQNKQVKIRSYNSEEHQDETADLKDILALGKVFGIQFYYKYQRGN